MNSKFGKFTAKYKIPMHNTPLIWKWMGSMLLEKAKTEYKSSPIFSFSDFGFLNHYLFIRAKYV